MMYRNQKLLRLAGKCPRCMWCGQFRPVVAAHSNQIRDGKGKGIKAHDYRIAYLCNDCHMEIDQGKRFDKAERKDIWEECHRKTIGWLFENGYLEVID